MSAQELQKNISFKIKKEDVKAQTKIELQKYAKKAKVDGFRPGKVPPNVVEQMYGSNAYEDALNQEINKSLKNLIIENKYNIVGEPKIDLTSSEGEEFIFSAIFEVIPEVKIGDLTTEAVDKPSYNVTDTEIDKTINSLLSQKATYISENKTAENNDKVTIDFVGTIDGVEFEGGRAENYSFILGKGSMLSDFEDGIKGLKAGENREIKVSFPDNYHSQNLKGKTAIFNIKVLDVAKEELPELNEDFVKSLGIKDGDQATLRAEIKKNMDYDVEQRLHAKVRENALNALLKVSPLNVPHVLVHDEIHHMMHVTEENMKNQGYKPEQIKLTHEMFDKDATRIVKLRLLIQQYIKDNSITINDDEVKNTVLSMAKLYEKPEEYIKWYYSDVKRVENAKAITMENKVIDSILTKVKVTLTTISYDDLIKH